MSTPKQPEDPPSQGAPPDANPAGNARLGIPEGAEAHEPKGTPNPGRHQTETTPKA